MDFSGGSDIEKVLRQIKKNDQKVLNRFKSIIHDIRHFTESALFVNNSSDEAFIEENESTAVDETNSTSATTKNGFCCLPVVANMRCGVWYAPIDSVSSRTCHFKSTDGHAFQYNFSETRLNVSLIELISDSGGCVVVDSTAKGKKYPDAMNRTIPIWCAVMTAVLSSRDDVETEDSNDTADYRLNEDDSHNHQQKQRNDSCQCESQNNHAVHFDTGGITTSTNSATRSTAASRRILPPWMPDSEEFYCLQNVARYIASVRRVLTGEAIQRLRSLLRGREIRCYWSCHDSSSTVSNAQGDQFTTSQFLSNLHNATSRKVVSPCCVATANQTTATTAPVSSVECDRIPPRTDTVDYVNNTPSPITRSSEKSCTDDWDMSCVIPVICYSASSSELNYVTAIESNLSWKYMQGAADDEEHWMPWKPQQNVSFMPNLIWENRKRILTATCDADCNAIVRQCIHQTNDTEVATKGTGNTDELQPFAVSVYQSKFSIALRDSSNEYACVTKRHLHRFTHIIDLRSTASEKYHSETHHNGRILMLTYQNTKRPKDAMQWHKMIKGVLKVFYGVDDFSKILIACEMQQLHIIAFLTAAVLLLLEKTTAGTDEAHSHRRNAGGLRDTEYASGAGVCTPTSLAASISRTQREGNCGRQFTERMIDKGLIRRTVTSVAENLRKSITTVADVATCEDCATSGLWSSIHLPRFLESELSRNCNNFLMYSRVPKL